MPADELSEVAEEADLYTVVPERFVAARDELVGRLRSDGDKACAGRVAKLRRPSLTVWALNQVARTSPDLIEGLLAAGRELRGAMQKALAGDASGLRPVQAQERAAVDRVVADALRRLGDAGHGGTDVMYQRMAATLRAAIVDRSVADALSRGVLGRDHDAPGFGMDALSSLTLVPSDNTSQRQGETAEGAHEARESSDDGGEALGREQEERQRRKQEAEEAHHQADRLARAAEELRAEADRLTGKAQRLAAEAEQAGKEAAEARGQADQAENAATAGRAEADALASAVSGPDSPPR